MGMIFKALIKKEIKYKAFSNGQKTMSNTLIKDNFCQMEIFPTKVIGHLSRQITLIAIRDIRW